MYVVLGASGNTGHIVANHLLEAGEKVRVVGRNAEHLQTLVSKGAEPFVANVVDEDGIAKAFQQADSAYVLIPPNLTDPDPMRYSNRVSDTIAAAVQKSKIKNVVALSSVGAELSSGTGPVVGLHNLEEKLNRINGVNALYLRAAYFMENTLAQAGAIRQMGSAAGPLHPDLKIAMIATRDIGAAAANILLRETFHGKQVRELQGQRDLSYAEATAIIGNAIGKPDLKYIELGGDQFRAAVTQMGMSDGVARLIAEMADALNSGRMRPLEPRTPQNSTPTSYETFVAEVFVPAYHQEAAA